MGGIERRQFVLAGAAAAAGTAATGAAPAEASGSDQQFHPPGGPRFRVVSDNDYSGDPDGLYQLAHLLLSPSVDVRAVIGSHLAPGDPFDPSTEQATNAYRRAVEVLRLLGLARTVPAYAGSNTALSDRHTPHRSAGALAIVREAMRTDTTLPMFTTFGAGLTELASAYLIEPRIADRLTAVWIGGPEYPDLAPPPPGASGIEYNLNIDLTAAQVVFNDSPIPVWQVPRNVYRQCLVSMTELLNEVRPAGRIGAYLYRHVADIFTLAAGAGLNLGETYILGDSPLVLLTALQSSFQPDPSSSRYVTRHAPQINNDGSYAEPTNGRQIRVYTDLDVRLMFSDLFTKLRHRSG
jgi:inosine-uridine nucleoside N-ribohydrolase